MNEDQFVHQIMTMMKGTDQFKNTIQAHLNSLAEKDSLFAETMKNPNKNIDDCLTYIFNQVKAS